MDYAFNYARNQLLGMSFKPFTLKTADIVYTWRGGLPATLCVLFTAIGLVSVARYIFARNVKVSL